MAPGLSDLGRALSSGIGSLALGGLRTRGNALAPETGETYEHEADETREVTAADGTRLHVEIDLPRGGGEPGRPTVVLSHGYTLSGRAWIFVRRRLSAAGYRVVTWDLRGHGRSALAEGGSYRFEDLAEDLRVVVEETCPEGSVALVGHSMGGMTQMVLGRLHPELVRERVVAVAFVATSAGGTGDLRVRLGDAVGRLAQRLGPYALAPLHGQEDLVARARKVGRQAEDFFTYRYSFASPVPLSLLHYAADIIMATPMEVMQAFLEPISAHDEREALAAYDGIEALVVNGAEDLMTPPQHSEEIVRLLPGAEHVVVADAGHLVMLEHPELVSEQLLALLARASRHPDAQAERRRGGRRFVTDVGHRRGSLSAEQARRRREQRRRALGEMSQRLGQVERDVVRRARRTSTRPPEDER